MEKKNKFITNIFFYGIIVFLMWAAFKYVMPVLVPFIIAFIIASLIRIPVKKLYGNSETRNKIISILTVIVFYGIVFSLLALLSIRLYGWISDFLSSAPTIYQESILPAFNTVFDLIERTLDSMDPEIAAEIDKVFQTFTNDIGELVKTFSLNALKLISGSLIVIPGFLIRLIITIISTFFFMIDYNKILVTLIDLIPKGKENTVTNLVKYFKSTVLIYLKSYSLLFLLTFSELTIGFTILRIPYSPLIALLVAIFDILPILGVGGVLLPWAGILLIMKNVPLAIGMLVLYLIIIFIRNTLEPKLVGQQIGLHPLATLIFMYLGLRFLGLLGMFLFPVTLAVIVSVKNGKKEVSAENKADEESAPAEMEAAKEQTAEKTK